MTGTVTAPTSQTCSPSTTFAIGADAASTVAGTLKSLADPLRLRMLSALATDPRGESCVCDLAVLADVSQPTVSHHLKVLKEAGILTSERRGTWVWYRIVPAKRHAVGALLEAFAPAAILTVTDHAGTADANSAEELRATDADVTRLAGELANQHLNLDQDLVLTIVRESYVGLARSVQVEHLITLTERFARQRLADLLRDRQDSVPQLLFVCVANAGRSQLAAAFANRISNGRVIARSAGSNPASDVHPQVRSLLTEINDETQAVYPKPLTDDAVRAADVVVTVGCGDVCPVIPDIRYEDWAVGDPALASQDGAVTIRDDIEARVRELLDRLAA